MPKSKLNIASNARISIRWKAHDYGSKGYYFITICCQNRLRWMGKVLNGKMNLNSVGVIVCREWIATLQKRSNVHLHAFAIMPDHIHGIIEIKFPIQSPKGDEKFCFPKNTIGSMIRGFKSATTVQVLEYISKHELHWRRGELTFAPNVCHEVSAADKSGLIFAQEKLVKTNPPFKLWQRGYHDRVIRDLDELKRIIRYISENPMRWSQKMDEDSLL
jgi:putative transposase